MFNPNQTTFPQEIQKDSFEQMKLYIKNLEQMISNQQNEIESLKKANILLEKEKIRANSNLSLKENTIRDISAILDNLKYKNEQFESKISELERQNTELNYINAELSQKNKVLMNSQFYQNNNSQNINSHISSLTDQLNEMSVIKNKLEFDNKNLQNKIFEIQNQYENEIKNLTKMKNLEIIQRDKVISELQNGLNSINNNENQETQNNNNSIQYSQMIMNDFNDLENKTKIVSNENIELKKVLNDLQNKIRELENLLIIKDKIIKELEEKNKEIHKEFNTKTEEYNLNLNSEDNLYEAQETQNTVNQLLIERDDLIRQNSQLKNGYEQFNFGIKEVNELFNQKVKSFESVLISYAKKIKEFQVKLKLSNDEKNKLIEENDKLKREKEKLEKKTDFNDKLKSTSPKLSNNNSRNYIQSGNYNNNNYPIDFQNQNSSVLRSGRRNILTGNSMGNYSNNLINEDPYADSQQKSLEEFKKILNKVDENLNQGKDKIILNKIIE